MSGHQGDGGPRNSFALLLDSAVGPLFVAKLLGNSGIWIQNIAGASLIYEITGSVFLVGLISLAQFAPQVLFSPLSGAMADRGDTRRQLVLGRSFCFLGGAVLAGWIWATGDLEAVPAWLVMAAASLVGIGYTIGSPALQALMPTLVRPGEMGRVVALDNLTFAVGRAVGPAVGGVLAATAGYAVAFAVAAAAQLVFVVVVATVRIPGAVRVEGASYSVRDGLRYVRTDPVVALVIAGVAAVGVGADPAITLAPALSDSLGGGPGLVGSFASAFGVGAIVGFFLQVGLLRFLDYARLAPLGLVLLAGGSAALPFATDARAAVAAFGVGGVGMTLALTGFTTLLYDRVPRQYLGRIMALWMVGFVGSRPLAAALGGGLADLFSADVALAGTAVVVLVVAFVTRPAVLRRPVPGR
ncbi:MFS transporter [Blastococcus tunisiensis]|uniref:Predicted arabinose efflux permease, MFS family n=1 Tax=Blastococcus tunisiensis TaxID=1798228 RepID=A0A1I1ZU79_9ACTN|nr:MFS transporter [Blastococcus sp. DSM 46838]SFE34928.1 Predicted arabinose efflux permease, MFS family [Blastococcus sp. DSM 46838]